MTLMLQCVMQLFFLSRTVSEWRVVNEMSENGFILAEKELHYKICRLFNRQTHNFAACMSSVV